VRFCFERKARWIVDAAWWRLADGRRREARKARFAKVVWRVGMLVVVDVSCLTKASLQPMERRRVAVVVFSGREQESAGVKKEEKAATIAE
jgi:hypothetical protein